MNTSPNALELSESSWWNHYSCFFVCLFVCQFVCLWVFGSCFFLLFFFFANRKEEEWHIATRGELWHLKSKLSDFIVLRRVNLMRSPQWPTIDQSIEVHYCSVWFKQALLAFSVLGLHWVLFVFLLKCPHAERSHDDKSSECSDQNWCWELTKVVTNESCFWFTSCSLFIYLFIFAWKLISTHLKLMKERFCHAVQCALIV